jgi:hypothetical protein
MWEKIKGWVAAISIAAAIGIMGVGSYQYLKKPNDYNIVPNTPINSSKADIVIEGPKEIKIGQLARFDVTKSAGKTFRWLVLPATKDFEIYDNGRKAVFTSGTPGEYTIIISCANDNEMDLKYVTIKVVGDVAPPPGPPGPVPPNPGGFIGKVVELATPITSANKKTEAAALAAGFDLTVSQIAAGSLTTADQIIEAQKTANRTALGNNITNWVPFLTALQGEMKTQAQAGLLVTADQHAALWKQISEGLKIVAK